MKYTFEIMKEYEDAFKGISVYSVSEDKKLMVDFVAREELEDAQKKIDEAYHRGYDKGYADKTNFDEVSKELAKDAYQRGLDDAWEAAKKVAFNSDDGGLDIEELDEIFGCYSLQGVFKAYSAQQTIEKLKAYEEKQKADAEIKVGDEVIYNEHRFIVFATETEEHYASLFDVNGRHASASQSQCKKTGRHFDIENILEEMKA